jgi:acyl dehydratase
MRYWEDFQVGQVLEYGGHTVTREEVLEFAREFDPQPFHLDEEAAAASPYGRIIASGWQTAGFFMRMLTDHVLADSASMGSPGVESLRWLRPVYPGDTLRVRQEVLEARPMASRAKLGLVKNRFHTLNQHGEVVMEMISLGIFSRREEPAA